MNVPTEEQWNEDAAAEIVQVCRDVDSGQITGIALVDPAMPANHPVQILESKHMIRAVAVRMVELAEHLPEPPRILRRASDVCDELRRLDE